MKNLVMPGAMLRTVLKLDALLSAVAGVVTVLGAAELAALTGLPVQLLVLAGLALLPFAGYVLWVASRAQVPAAAVWAVIAVNVLWAVESAFIAFGSSYALTALGVGYALFNAAYCLVFADLEYVALKRSARATA
jgi:hypothetical protein